MTLPRLMVAPNGATRSKLDHPALPMTIGEIVATAQACVEAGADGMHAHVRDASGQHVLDVGLYAELLAELAAQIPGLYVQITTEAVGRYSPQEQADLVYRLRPKAVSVALREMLSDDHQIAGRFYHFCAEAGIEVQHILYEPAEIHQLAQIVGAVVPCPQSLAVLHVLGRYTPGQQSSRDDLTAPLEKHAMLGPVLDWAVCAFGPAETEILATTLRLGGKARIGFENNLFNPDGKLARDNAERVRVLNAMVKQIGHQT